MPVDDDAPRKVLRSTEFAVALLGYADGPDARAQHQSSSASPDCFVHPFPTGRHRRAFRSRGLEPTRSLRRTSGRLADKYRCEIFAEGRLCQRLHFTTPSGRMTVNRLRCPACERPTHGHLNWRPMSIVLATTGLGGAGARDLWGWNDGRGAAPEAPTSRTLVGVAGDAGRGTQGFPAIQARSSATKFPGLSPGEFHGHNETPGIPRRR